MNLTRKLAFSAALACLALALGTSPALASSHHKHHVKTHHHHGKSVKASSSKTIVRIAQEHLAHLGYYMGPLDGAMGPQTKAAIKSFQRDHSLKADGVLGSKTKSALEYADHQVYGTRGLPLTHENVTLSDGTNADNVTDQDFATSLNGGTKVISSRFARLDVGESGEGANKRYTVNLNGQPVLLADGQPSIIGISPTYDLGDEEAVVFTTFSPNGANCIYRNHVLTISGAGSKLLDIGNCTRDFQAQVNSGSLYITFPERDDNRAVGATWRLEGTDMERL